MAQVVAEAGADRYGGGVRSLARKRIELPRLERTELRASPLDLEARGSDEQRMELREVAGDAGVGPRGIGREPGWGLIGV